MLKMIIHLTMLYVSLLAFLDVCLYTTGDGVRNDVRAGGEGDHHSDDDDQLEYVYEDE